MEKIRRLDNRILEYIQKRIRCPFLDKVMPFHPVTGEVVGNGMKEQAVQTLANMKAVLEAAGLAVTDIAKTTVFVTNMDDFAAFNEVYAAFMGEHRPARVCVEVSNIAHGCLLEMDAICFKE